MKNAIRYLLIIAFVALCGLSYIDEGTAQKAASGFQPAIPKVWDDEAISTIEVPLPDARFSPVHVSSEYYYKIPVRPIYKDYPIYRPDKEPPGYMDWLKRQKPQIIGFESTSLKTEADWIKAGEQVFDAPVAYDTGTLLAVVQKQHWYEKVNVPVTKEGIFPFGRYVIREEGKVELGLGACANCHTRVMSDGSIIKAAQGNFPIERSTSFELEMEAGRAKDKKEFLEKYLLVERSAWGAPWLEKDDPFEHRRQLPLEEIIASYKGIPATVIARNRSSIEYPTRVPDLIGVKDRRYLDATGLVQHRSIGDLMRYAALNQGAESLARFGDFIPGGDQFRTLPDPSTQSRYGDEQLYALALYIYSLKPPANPNKFGPLAARGKKVFDKAGCALCHTPPLYTNNTLMPAAGFKVPEEHLRKFKIMIASVGTDSNLTMKTRRGTGYYKVPSLKGVWYRNHFGHSGFVATLEEWFDPRRIRDDYKPTGFRGYGKKSGAVQGHEFGLSLLPEERNALIAFLKTL